MKQFKITFLIIALMMIISNVGWGQVTLPHLDAINYTVGQGLQTQTGWTSLNSGDALLIASGNLTYIGLPASTGNKVTFDGTGIDAAKLFTQQTTGTVYYSFIVNISSLGSLNTTGGYFTGFNEGTSTNYGATVWTRKDAVDGTKFDIGINPRTTAANTVWSSAQTVNTAIFVVISYQIVSGTGNDIVKLWINPALGGSEPSATLSATNTGGTDLANVNRILIRQDAATTTPFVEMDELRIGTTWADVAPSATLPTVSVSTSSLSAFTSTVGTPSVSQTYTVSATNLKADLVITPPTGFEVRENGIGTFGSSLSFTPVSGTVSTKTVEVQFNPASVGTYTGSISNASTGATTMPVSVTGVANAIFYNISGTNLDDVINWGSKTNGGGTRPLNFTSDNQTFVIKNGSSATIANNWTVSGTSSKVILGDGTNAINFTIPNTALLSGTIDLTANSTLTVQNSTLPTFGTVNSASTIDFAQTGSFTIPVNTYPNLKLTGGTKVFSGNTTTVSGNLTFDNATIDAPGVSPFATIALGGDLTYLGIVGYPADANSITLNCSKNGTQTITGNGNTVRFFRIATVGISTNVVLSSTGGSSNLLLANLSGGGLTLAAGTNLTVNSNTVTFLTNGKGAFISTGTLSCDGTSSLVLSTITATPGTIYFASGSNSLNNLTVNETSTGSFVFGSSVNVTGTLTMLSGDINMGSNTLTLGSSTSTLGTLDRTSGTIIGKFARWFAANTSVFRLFPVGTTTLYRPVDLSFTGAPSTGGTLTVEHIASNPGVINASPLDDNGYSLDSYSQVGYWRMTIGNGLSNDGVYSVNLTMAGIIGVSDVTKLHIIKRSLSTDPWTVDGTHIDGTGATNNPTCSRSDLTGFSEFGIASNFADNPLDGVLPVSLSTLNSSVTGRNIKLNWTTASETNNSGFDIERMNVSDNNWSKIGFVSGHGTVSTPSNYSFEDRNLMSGKYKYRLKQIDVNGNFEYFALNGEVEVGVPKTFNLSQNYPNPFNPVTKINFDLPENGKVDLRLYDMLGREVAILVNEVRTAGYYTVNFDASKLSSGIYFYRMNAGKFSSIKKMAVIK